MWKLEKEDFHPFLSYKEKEARGYASLALVVDVLFSICSCSILDVGIAFFNASFARVVEPGLRVKCSVPI